jgi:hypothetical protein
MTKITYCKQDFLSARLKRVNDIMASMKRLKEKSIYWQRPFGWRTGTYYIPPYASAVDVIRYEQEELGNKLDIPDFLLDELQQKQIRASDIIWLCRTRDHARRYNGECRGQPYKEDLGLNALILATDCEAEIGYLVLKDASQLNPKVIQLYTLFRQERPLASRPRKRTRL